MPKPVIKRSVRPLTDAEREQVQQALADFEEEKDEIIARARRARDHSLALRETCKLLRAEREAQGLSLAEIQRRTGIAQEALSRLENDPHPNPQILTLQRYADALGKQVQVTLAPLASVAAG